VQARYWLGNAYGNRIGQVNYGAEDELRAEAAGRIREAVELDPALLVADPVLLADPGRIGGGVDKARAQSMAIGRYDRARGLLAEGGIARHEKNPAQALKAYQQAYALKPRDAKVRLALLIAQQDAGRWDEAYEIARRWSVDEPRNGKPWYYMGRLAAQSGKFLEQGEAALRNYLTLPRQPGDPEPKHAR